jgi:Cu/Ag efflux pump CusA
MNDSSFLELQQAQKHLEIIVSISLALIMVLLYGLFNSLRDRLLALAGVPFAIGLLPAAISHGIGSQVQWPSGTVIVSGMLLGPIMLPVVVPALRMVFLRKDQHPAPWQPDRRDVAPEHSAASSRSMIGRWSIGPAWMIEVKNMRCW